MNICALEDVLIRSHFGLDTSIWVIMHTEQIVLMQPSVLKMFGLINALKSFFNNFNNHL